MVGVVVAGIIPFDIRPDIQAEVEFNGVIHSLKQAFEVLGPAVARREMTKKMVRRVTSNRLQRHVHGASGQAPGGSALQGTAPGLKGGAGQISKVRLGVSCIKHPVRMP